MSKIKRSQCTSATTSGSDSDELATVVEGVGSPRALSVHVLWELIEGELARRDVELDLDQQVALGFAEGNPFNFLARCIRSDDDKHQQYACFGLIGIANAGRNIGMVIAMMEFVVGGGARGLCYAVCETLESIAESIDDLVGVTRVLQVLGRHRYWRVRNSASQVLSALIEAGHSSEGLWPVFEYLSRDSEKCVLGNVCNVLEMLVDRGDIGEGFWPLLNYMARNNRVWETTSYYVSFHRDLCWVLLKVVRLQEIGPEFWSILKLLARNKEVNVSNDVCMILGVAYKKGYIGDDFWSTLNTLAWGIKKESSRKKVYDLLGKLVDADEIKQPEFSSVLERLAPGELDKYSRGPVDSLLKKLVEKEEIDEQWWAVLETLGKSSNNDVRRAAFRVLKALGDAPRGDEHVWEVLKELTKSEFYIRMEAFEALRFLGKSTNSEIRQQALMVLEDLSQNPDRDFETYNAAFGSLRILAESENLETRQGAFEKLEALAHAENSTVRELAFIVFKDLARFNNSDVRQAAFGILQAMAQSDHSDTQNAALSVMNELGPDGG